MADDSRSRSSTVRLRIASRSADVVLVAVRELRLVLGLLLILFVTAETWRYAGRLSTFRLILLALSVSAVALLVVWMGLRHTLPRSAAGAAATRVIIEVLTFGATLFATFVVAGVLTIDAGLAAEWSGDDGGVVVSLGIGRPRLVVTRQLLQVAASLAALGTLAFAVEVIVDAGTRHTLTHDLVDPADGDVADDDR